jgi:SAM-dependent methyltransferase
VTDINSRDYWSTRFATNWAERRGHEQSRFFGAVAAQLMPPWLAGALGEGATVCDWGCAAGDGTVVLAQALPAARVTGIDFSPVAIEQARSRHPQLEFACRDLLQEEPGTDFDAVFSSNVLEHFAAPAEVLGKLARHARRWMIHLVPFREPLVGREPEHLAAFDWRDIALRPAPGWCLLHAAVIDAGRLPDNHWGGEQLLMIYARDAERDRLDLSLADVRIDSALRMREFAALTADSRALSEQNAALAANAAADAAEIARLAAESRVAAEGLAATGAQLAATQARLGVLEKSLAAAEASLAATQTSLAATAASLRATTADLATARDDLATIRNSRIWRWTALLRRAGGS